jgi:hypothetical protein
MKHILTFFMAFIIFSCSNPVDRELPQYRLIFISGCNTITKSKVNVYIKDHKYFADRILPSYFDGQTIHSLWTIELNQIDACIQSINKTKSLPNKCDRFSSSENHHILVIEKDTIDVNGDCHCENLDFHFLDKKLFSEKHLEIEEQKKCNLTNLNKELSGKWYLQRLQKALQRDDIVSFSRSKVTNIFIVFGDKSTLTGKCINLLKMEDLKRYRTELSDGLNETVFSFDWGEVTLVKEYNT